MHPFAANHLPETQVVAAAAEVKMEGWTVGWAVGRKEGWWEAVQVVVRMEE